MVDNRFRTGRRTTYKQPKLEYNTTMYAVHQKAPYKCPLKFQAIYHNIFNKDMVKVWLGAEGANDYIYVVNAYGMCDGCP